VGTRARTAAANEASADVADSSWTCLLILLDGSWVAVYRVRGVTERELGYLLQGSRSLAPLTFLGRCLAVFALAAVWECCALFWQRALFRQLLRGLWFLASLLACLQFLEWRRFAADYVEKINNVFAAARQKGSGKSWAGVYAIGDLAGQAVAIAPDARVARVVWTCDGRSRVAWGRLREQGQWLRFDFESSVGSEPDAFDASERLAEARGFDESPR
jgi:hypothetical protein